MNECTSAFSFDNILANVKDISENPLGRSTAVYQLSDTFASRIPAEQITDERLALMEHELNYEMPPERQDLRRCILENLTVARMRRAQASHAY
jgi:hypothetical protein